MPFCPNCGSPVQDTDNACGNCGAPLREVPVENMGYQPPAAPQPPVVDQQTQPCTTPDQGSYEAPSSQPQQQAYQPPQGYQPPQQAYQMPQYNAQPQQNQYQQPQYNAQPQYNGQPQYNPQAASNDSGSFGWGVLGCCVPIVGLILFLVWKDTKPKSAKVAGIGALVCVGINLVLFLISLITGMFA